MTITKETVQKIEVNWGVLKKLLDKIPNEERKQPLEKLCEDLKDRFAVCPASTRLEYIGAYPGGLVQYSLKVLKVMTDLNKTYEASQPLDSMILVSLMHNIGKVGNEEEDYYLENESNWHRERGMMYEVNKNISNIPVTVRSLWWLNSRGIKLSEEELFAISSMQDMARSEYNGNELYQAPKLAVMLQHAARITCINGKGKKSVLDW